MALPFRAELTSLARRFLPAASRRAIHRWKLWPPVGLARWGSLRRVTPISSHWGMDRGQPVDRYYIERFLADHAKDIRGHVLEIGDDSYTRRFGGANVRRADVLHVAEKNERVTLIGDLTSCDHIASDAFDCFILTQTLQLIYDLPAAVKNVHRILKPGGVVLASVPGISKISRYDMERWGYYWSFTSRSARRLFEAAFPPERVDVNAHGNVLAAIAFLHGLAAEELKSSELDYCDPDYEVVIAVRAQKPE